VDKRIKLEQIKTEVAIKKLQKY